MIDSWSWFRERADVELGDVPPEPADRLDAVVASAAPPTRRRLSEIGAAAGVALIAIALVAVTVVVSRQDPASSGPTLPAPSELGDQSERTDQRSPAPAPGGVGTSGTPGRTYGPTGRLPGRTASPTAPPTSRAGAPGTPTGPTSTTPRRSTPAPTPTKTTPTPTPTATPPPTTTEPPPPTTTPPPPVVPLSTGAALTEPAPAPSAVPPGSTPAAIATS